MLYTGNREHTGINILIIRSGEIAGEASMSCRLISKAESPKKAGFSGAIYSSQPVYRKSYMYVYKQATSRIIHFTFCLTVFL